MITIHIFRTKDLPKRMIRDAYYSIPPAEIMKEEAYG